jgi:hypothetical protein
VTMTEMTANDANPEMTRNRFTEPDWTSGDLRKLADAVVCRLQEAKPMVSLEDVEAAEGRLSGTADLRRELLAILSWSGASLIERVEGDRDFAVRIARAHLRFGGYAEELRGLSELLECALARIVVALSGRIDFDEIMAAASSASAGKPR